MQAEVRQQEQLEEELDQERAAEEERLGPILESARASHQAAVNLQKKQMEINAQRADEFHESIIEEQEQRLREEGFFDGVEAATGEDQEEADPANRQTAPEEEPPSKKGGGVSASQESGAGRAKPKKSRLYCLRDGKYVLTSTVKLTPGENLYRKRPRSFGVSEKYIKHGVVS
jgi:hypothetical protein